MKFSVGQMPTRPPSPSRRTTRHTAEAARPRKTIERSTSRARASHRTRDAARTDVAEEDAEEEDAGKEEEGAGDQDGVGRGEQNFPGSAKKSAHGVGDDDEDEQGDDEEDNKSENEEEEDGIMRDEDGLPITLLRGNVRPLQQAAPYSDKELSSAVARLNCTITRGTHDAALCLPCEKQSRDDLLLPTGSIHQLLPVCAFLSAFRNQLDLLPHQFSMQTLDRALADRESTSLPLVQLHLALMRFILSASADSDTILRILGSSREPRHLCWQESVAQFLVWLCPKEHTISHAIRAFRSQEYHEICSEMRLLVLKALSEAALAQDKIRLAVGRRAEWKHAQAWDWDAAVVLGRVQQRMEPSQLVRMEPLGRDRNGCLYFWFERAVWVLSETGYHCIREASSMRRLLQSLIQPEHHLHLALSNLLLDGAFQGLATSDHAVLARPLLPRPKYEKVLGCAINCTLSGRSARLFVLDLLRHVQHFEAHLPKQLFDPGWEQKRTRWVADVDAAQSAPEFASALIELESALARDAFKQNWMSSSSATGTPHLSKEPCDGVEPCAQARASMSLSRGLTGRGRGYRARGGPHPKRGIGCAPHELNEDGVEYAAEEASSTESEDDDKTGSDASEMEHAGQHVTCAACTSGDDAASLLICDGCDAALHTYCARPPLLSVPEGDWYCETCCIKTHLLHAEAPDARINARALSKLPLPSDSTCVVWRLKAALSQTCCQLLEHMRVFVEAFDRLRLKPLAEEVSELNRLEKNARKELDAQLQAQRKKEHAEHKELVLVIESLVQQVERSMKTEARDAARLAKERAQEEARIAKAQARQARELAEEEAKLARERAKQEAKDAKEQTLQEQRSAKEREKEAKERAKEEARNAKEYDREQARLAREQAHEEARQAREAVQQRMRLAREQAQVEAQAQRDERMLAKIVNEVARVVDRLISKVEKANKKELEDQTTELYCICQKPYNHSLVYIGCDVCEEWFHAKCVGLNAKLVATVESFVCSACELSSSRKTQWKDIEAMRAERAAQKQQREVRLHLERIIRKLEKNSERVLRAQHDDLYCICRKPYNAQLCYIACDICDDWFHAKCVGLSAKSVGTVDRFVCKECESSSGEQTTWNQRNAVLHTGQKRKSADSFSYPRVVLKLQYPTECFQGVCIRLSGVARHSAGSSMVPTEPLWTPTALTAQSSASFPAPQIGLQGSVQTGVPRPPPDQPPSSLPPSPPGSPVATPELFGAAPPPEIGSNTSAASEPPPQDALESQTVHPSETFIEDRKDECNSETGRTDGGHLSRQSKAWYALAFPDGVGSAVEVGLPDHGLEGSWFPASIEEVAPTMVLVSIRGLRDESHIDGALREWHSVSVVRPSAPPTPTTFIAGLKQGSLAELWWQHGWWQVVVIHIPSQVADASTPAEGIQGGEWVFESLQYGNRHRMSCPSLRPCWRWDTAKAGSPDAWTIIASIHVASPPNPQPPQPDKRATKRKAPEQVSVPTEVERDAKEEEPDPPPVKQFVPDELVEVRGIEEGFFGSWYVARVLELREGRAGLRLRLCYQAFQEDDGSFWEDWLDVSNVRPIPPPHESRSFIEKLKKGAPLEIHIEEGWWEVEFCRRDGDKFVVAATRYNIEHTVPSDQLRPAWNWSHQTRKWLQLERPPKAIKSEVASSRGAASSKSSKKPKSRAKSS